MALQICLNAYSYIFSQLFELAEYSQNSSIKMSVPPLQC